MGAVEGQPSRPMMTNTHLNNDRTGTERTENMHRNRTRSSMWTALFLFTLACSRVGAQVTINTDNLTINGSSTTFNGFPMTAQNVGGIARFTIFGNILIPSG